MRLTKKEFYICLVSAAFLFIAQHDTVRGENETSSSISGFDILDRTLNSVEKIDLNAILPIGKSNFSGVTGETIPILESFVFNDSNYSREKANAENATLTSNFVEVKQPVQLDNLTVRNYLINQNNISKVAGIRVNDSCIVSSATDSGKTQYLNICNPPDVQIAPGKDHVIEMTNNFIGVWNKTDILSNKTVIGETDKINPLYWTNNFFKISQKNDTFDPSIIYDRSSHRWFSTIVEFENPDDEDLRKSDKMGVLLSYSAPDNYKRWTVMKFSPRLIIPGDRTYYFCPDRPMIHASSDKVLISMTVSDPHNNYCDERNISIRYLFMAVFDKRELLDDEFKKKNFDAIYLEYFNYHYVPVKSNSDKSDINLVNVPPYPASNSRLSFMKLSGTVQNLQCNIYGRDLDYPKQLPPNAVQKGTNYKLYLADNRIIDAVETRDNGTWITFQNGCDSGVNNTSCIRLIKLNVDEQSPFRKCSSQQSMNATSEYYEGGNMTAVNDLNLSQIPDMASNGNLPLPVANEIVSEMVNDPELASSVLDEVTSKLNVTMTNNFNTSEIIEMVSNESLPSPIANDIVSELVSDPNLAPKIVNDIRYNLISNLMIKRDLDFQIGSDLYYYYYPAIAVSKNGSLVVYFGFSSKNNYPSLGLLVLNTTLLSQSGDSVNGTLKYDPILVKNGTAFAKEESITEESGCSLRSPCTRYGDYFSIANDPFDDSILWAAGEYYDDDYFSTIISSIRLR